MRTPKKGGREGGRGGRGGREGGEVGEGGKGGKGGREVGREGGVTDCYTYSNIIKYHHSI